MSTSFPLDGMRVRFSGETNVGSKRDHNEDAFFLPVAEKLAIVADGMGGHASGEVASKLAVDTVVSHFQTTENEQEQTWPYKIDRNNRYHINRMVSAIKLANLQIHQTAEQKAECHGMGTTVVASIFVDGVMIVGHVGDSRLYRLRDGRLDQLTEDHSLLNDYVKMKRLSAGDAASFPHKNVIVRALGMKASVEVDIIVDKPRLHDLYILCTDGLSGMVPDPEMAELAGSEPELDKLCDRLIAVANAHGGLDNITVVCARLEPL
jgi:protein phosphatase